MINGEGSTSYSDSSYYQQSSEQAAVAEQSQSIAADSSSEREDLSEDQYSYEESGSEQGEQQQQSSESGEEFSTDAGGYSEREDLSGGTDTLTQMDAQGEFPTTDQAQPSEEAKPGAGERPDLSGSKSYSDADTVYYPDAAEPEIESGKEERTETPSASERQDLSEPAPHADADQAATSRSDASDQSKQTPDRQVDAKFGAKLEARDAASEAAERQKVEHPKDGVGFGFGDKNPAKGEMDRWLKSLSENLREALSDKDCKVRITAHASRPGGDAYNQQLSDQRAQVIKDWLLKEGAQASIDAIGLGEGRAIIEGKPDNFDDANDRTAKIEVQPHVERYDFSDDYVEVKKTSIPKDYTNDYKYSREQAQSAWHIGLSKLREVLPIGKPTPDSVGRKAVTESFSQISDTHRWEKEFTAAKTVDEKLWNVRPPRGFVFDKDKTSNRWRVEYWLNKGGYDANKMYDEYVVHWLRKGAI